ncbi:MAG: hypothetical protein RR877_10490 [Aurantimicrobium sp.]|uniref:hypothetical protein n=1 Tax=Aurantimicrobium sp. TaxID=1930784 RepID=UPI002FC5F8A8
MNNNSVPAPELPEGYSFSVVECVTTSNQERIKQWGPFWWTVNYTSTKKNEDAVTVVVKLDGVGEVARSNVDMRSHLYVGNVSFPQRIANRVEYLANRDHAFRKEKAMVRNVLGDYPPKVVIG